MACQPEGPNPSPVLRAPPDIQELGLLCEHPRQAAGEEMLPLAFLSQSWALQTELCCPGSFSLVQLLLPWF